MPCPGPILEGYIETAKPFKKPMAFQEHLQQTSLYIYLIYYSTLNYFTHSQQQPHAEQADK